MFNGHEFSYQKKNLFLKMIKLFLDQNSLDRTNKSLCCFQEAVMRALLIDDREVGSDSLDASQNSSSANEVTQCAWHTLR